MLKFRFTILDMKQLKIRNITAIIATIGFFGQWFILAFSSLINPMFYDSFGIIVSGLIVFTVPTTIFHAKDESLILRRGTHWRISIFRFVVAGINAGLIALVSGLSWFALMAFQIGVFGILFNPSYNAFKGHSFFYRGTQAFLDKIGNTRAEDTAYYLVTVAFFIVSCIWLFYNYYALI